MSTWPTTSDLTQDLSSYQTKRPEAPTDIEFTQLRPELLRFLIGFGVNGQDAEDITHDAFLKSLHRTSTSKIDNLFHWLCTCAKNLAITRYHRARREVLISPEHWQFWEGSLPHPDRNALSLLEEKEKLHALAQAFSLLGRREQRCLILRSNGSTFREIAELLNISLRSAVYSTGMALRKLHRELNASDL